MFEEFRITQRHYDIILKQGYDNLPQESGGFIGGNAEGNIQAILPLFNMHLYDKTGTFIFTPEDLDRAYAFFKKHGLQYYGLYHTHPQGIAYPSKEDVDSGQKYHFILSFKNPKKPEFAAYHVKLKEVIPVSFKIVSDKGFRSIPINGSDKKQGNILDPTQEAERLEGMIEDIKESKPVKYPLMPPKSKFEDSDFSTLA